MNQLDLLRIAGRFRDLLGHLNTIDWNQFHHYHNTWANDFSRRDALPSFAQFRKELKDTIGYLPAGNRLVQAFEGLSVDSEAEWPSAKSEAWNRFHAFCDATGILRDHTSTPVFDTTPDVAIVPGDKIKDFDFSVSCDVDFEAYPEGSVSFYEHMRRGNCRDCQRPLAVSATDEAVLKRVYRQCIEKVKRDTSVEPTRKNKRKLDNESKQALQEDAVLMLIIARHFDDNWEFVTDAPYKQKDISADMSEHFKKKKLKIGCSPLTVKRALNRIFEIPAVDINTGRGWKKYCRLCGDIKRLRAHLRLRMGQIVETMEKVRRATISAPAARCDTGCEHPATEVLEGRPLCHDCYQELSQPS